MDNVTFLNLTMDLVHYAVYNNIMNEIDIKQLKNEIKSYMVRKGVTLKDLADTMAKKYERPTITLNNLSNKLNKGTLKHTEVLEIADTLGYKLDWIEK